MQRCHLLTSFQEGPCQKIFFQEKSKFCKQGGKLDYSRYLSQAFLLVVLESCIAIIELFLSLKYKEGARLPCNGNHFSSILNWKGVVSSSCSKQLLK